MKNNPTFRALVFLLLVVLVGAIANIYFTLNSLNYVSPDFDPYSVWDWWVILWQALAGTCILFIAIRQKDKYAKTFWLFFAAIIMFGIVKDYISPSTGELSKIISILENVVIFSVLLIFLFLYKKHKFNLFEGLKKDKA